MLAAAPGVAVDPRFGVASARAHETSGATSVAGELATLRHDVDTIAGLATALRIGVGPRTAHALAALLGHQAGATEESGSHGT